MNTVKFNTHRLKHTARAAVPKKVYRVRCYQTHDNERKPSESRPLSAATRYSKKPKPPDVSYPDINSLRHF